MEDTVAVEVRVGGEEREVVEVADTVRDDREVRDIVVRVDKVGELTGEREGVKREEGVLLKALVRLPVRVTKEGLPEGVESWDGMRVGIVVEVTQEDTLGELLTQEDTLVEPLRE